MFEISFLDLFIGCFCNYFRGWGNFFGGNRKISTLEDKSENFRGRFFLKPAWHTVSSSEKNMKSATDSIRDRLWFVVDLTPHSIDDGTPWQFIFFLRNIPYTLRWQVVTRKFSRLEFEVKGEYCHKQ